MKGRIPDQIIKFPGAKEHLAGVEQWGVPHQPLLLQILGYSWLRVVKGRSHIRSLMPPAEPNQRKGGGVDGEGNAGEAHKEVEDGAC